MSGITSPPHPIHGPWRRHAAQAGIADIRATNFVNDAPVINVGTGETNIAENTPVGKVIRTISAMDPDGDNLVYSISAGNDDGRFAIDQNGQLTLVARMDYETRQSYSLMITVDDGHGESDTAEVIVNVTDVDEQQQARSTNTGGGGGGCSLRSGAPFDPVLMLMFLIAVFYRVRSKNELG